MKISLPSCANGLLSKVINKDKYSSTDKIHQKAEVIASKLPPLLVSAERVAATVSQGVHGRRSIGQGETFWQFRRYEFGDATNLIDWRQSGKNQHVFVRETEWEAAQTVCLWRDGSDSMMYRSLKSLPKKADRADLILLALSSLLIRGGERIAMLGTSMKPSASRATPVQICAMIEKRMLPGLAIPDKNFIPKHSHTIWVGDFLSPLTQIKEIIAYYASQGIRGYILQILDPAEKSLPYDGRILFRKMEEEDKDVLVRDTESIREKYQKEMRGQIEGIKQVTKSFGWKFFSHQTDHKPEQILNELFSYFSESKIGKKWFR